MGLGPSLVANCSLHAGINCLSVLIVYVLCGCGVVLCLLWLLLWLLLSVATLKRVIVTPADIRSTAQKSHCVTNIRGHQKTHTHKTMKLRRPRKGQQCIMKCQEDNRSKTGTLREKEIKVRRP